MTQAHDTKTQTTDQISAGLARWAPAQVRLIKSKTWQTPGDEYEFVCAALGAVMRLGATRDQAVAALLTAGYDLNAVLQ